MTAQNHRLRRVAAGLAVALTATLAACAPEPVPAFTPPVVPELAPPVVNDVQAAAIFDAVEQAIAAGDATLDVEALRPRVSALALETRQAEYTLQTASGGTRMPQQLWTDSELFVVSATDSWPRNVLAVSDPTEGTTVRLYLGLVQDGPRDPYRLVAWSRLLPGIETPTVASAEIGSAPLTADSAGFKVTPTEAVAHLADVMTNPAGAYAAEFAPDLFREVFAAEQVNLQSQVQADGAVVGEVSTTTTPGPVVFAIASAEGGAIVMASVDSSVTMRKTVPEATLNPGGEITALGGVEPITGAMVSTYKQMVTLYVPPASQPDQLIQVLGFERVLTSVTRVD